MFAARGAPGLAFILRTKDRGELVGDTGIAENGMSCRGRGIGLPGGSEMELRYGDFCLGVGKTSRLLFCGSRKLSRSISRLFQSNCSPSKLAKFVVSLVTCSASPNVLMLVFGASRGRVVSSATSCVSSPC